jgi:hypothetical protein
MRILLRYRSSKKSAARRRAWVSIAAAAGFLLLAGMAITGCRSGDNAGGGHESTTLADHAPETRGVTTSILQFSGPVGADPISRLMGSKAVSALGIQLTKARAPNGGQPPGLFYLEARTASGRGAGAYQALGEKLLAIAETYKHDIPFDRLQVVLRSSSGGTLYDHTFPVVPAENTPAPTILTQVYYSAPSLDVSPRAGVKLTTSISTVEGSSEVLVSVQIRNTSGTSFHFPSTDLELYVAGHRAAQRKPEAGPIDVPSTGDGLGGIDLAFIAPDFDPATSGLLYRSSDPLSAGFTGSDGVVP